MVPRIHFIHHSLIMPGNPVTVNLIGAGGTGSHLLESLAITNKMLIELGHPGMQVSLWDDDRINEANVAKQRFAESEVGLYKAAALINRTNRTFGTHWKAITRKFGMDYHGRPPEDARASMYVSCVDKVPIRFEIAEILGALDKSDDRANRPVYWLDTGNSQKSGQALLSTIGHVPQPAARGMRPVGHLPFITDLYREELLQAEDQDDTPSCSAVESLEKQDLFINAIIAKMASNLLWSLLRNQVTTVKGFFVNLETYRSEPILV
ncbi:MAG: PRTRC system ThiF family protein [Candidatus Pseudobacter hemicellulosilyticus]|uniref:PRTRC system ThiF family protein n=1 Tax=Candidatus Pseudobacter hemicellulosilyticus TaxID=3121375 RepID=A0AAJ5WSD4_9BACT|nr:MAG: PRTRC system ThiF family protein [Pseudobacter sp.]